MRAAAVLMLSAAVLSAGCLGDRGETPDRAEKKPIAVTRDDAGLPTPCRPGSIARRLVGFTDALRATDIEALRRYWVRSRFDFFGINEQQKGNGGGRILIWARQPEAALRYVKMQGGLHIRLRGAEINAVRREGGVRGADVGIGGWWTETTSGGVKRRQFLGKTFASCEGGNTSIAAWGITVYPAEREVGITGACPGPRHPRRGAVVACVGGGPTSVPG
jgi:hypothetical protein